MTILLLSRRSVLIFKKEKKNVNPSIECHTKTRALIRKHAISTDYQRVLLDQVLLVPGAESRQQHAPRPTAMCSVSSGHRSVPVKRYIWIGGGEIVPHFKK